MFHCMHFITTYTKLARQWIAKLCLEQFKLMILFSFWHKHSVCHDPSIPHICFERICILNSDQLNDVVKYVGDTNDAIKWIDSDFQTEWNQNFT